MRRVRVAAAALNQTPLDWDGNRDRIVAALELARQAEVAILCLPELCVTGYGCEDAFLSPAVRASAERVLAEVLPHTRGVVVSLGLPVAIGGGVFNCQALVSGGRVTGLVAKHALAGDGVHYEPRWFKSWPRGARGVARLLGESVPVGELVFQLGDVRLGFEICEDAWTAERPGAALARASVDVILNPSASHFAFGKHAVRRRLVLEGSRAFGACYVYANLVGNEAGRVVYDGDALVAAGGEIVAEGRRFSFKEVSLVAATVDLDVDRTRRSWRHAFRPEVDLASLPLVTVDTTLPASPPLGVLGRPALWEGSADQKHEEFTRAVALGLHDYLRKSRSRGFVVSLSGGADSSAVACLSALSARLPLAELGAREVARRLPWVPGLAALSDDRAVVGALLTGVYQGTSHSSETTRTAAKGLAEALGARFHDLDVAPIVAAYTALVEGAIGRPLTWERDDIPLQNIQARVRSPGVWMLANLLGALLLSTSNRSEAAVGYATMDGDTSGGLSPIAGIDKAYLRRWLRWMEETGPSGVGPTPALGPVNVQAPTAELRPPEQSQTDEADLMPYDVLDEIERAAIRDKRGPDEVLALLAELRPRVAPAVLRGWVERFFTLFSRNQWKRERYAPSFHLDDENLDPKTWCRWPILSGGFARELSALAQDHAKTMPGAGLGSPATRRASELFVLAGAVPADAVPDEEVPEAQRAPRHASARSSEGGERDGASLSRGGPTPSPEEREP